MKINECQRSLIQNKSTFVASSEILTDLFFILNLNMKSSLYESIFQRIDNLFVSVGSETESQMHR